MVYMKFAEQQPVRQKTGIFSEFGTQNDLKPQTQIDDIR